MGVSVSISTTRKDNKASKEARQRLLSLQRMEAIKVSKVAYRQQTMYEMWQYKKSPGASHAWQGLLEQVARFKNFMYHMSQKGTRIVQEKEKC